MSAIAARTLPSGATAGVDDAAWALADRLAASPYTSDNTDALTQALARAGVATFADPLGSAPEVGLSGIVSPFELLDFQTHALAVGAWSNTTWSGAQIDGLLSTPSSGSGLAPVSALLAGYVAAVDTPGAALARALMAGQNLLDPATLQFPGVVLVLFSADLASSDDQAPAASASPDAVNDSPLLAMAEARTDARPITAQKAAAGGACSTAANWIQGMIDRLFNSLKVAAPSNLFGAIAAAIWNWIVDRLQDFVEGIITTVTDLVTGYVRNIARMIAGISEQVASLLPYGVKVAVTGPNGNAFDLTSSGAPFQGAYVVSVSAGDLPDWPDILKDCATVAGIALPDFHSKDVPLTWGPLDVIAPNDPLLAPVPLSPTNATTDASGQATWNFQTGTDPGDPTGPFEIQLDVMHVAVHRPELDQIRAALTNALLGFVPSILRSSVSAVIGWIAPDLDGIQNSVNALLDVPGTGTAVLEFHGKAKPSPSPQSPSPGPSTACTASLAAGTYTGQMTTDTVTEVPPGAIDLGEAGTTTDHGTGPVSVTVAPDGTLSGTFTLDVTSKAEYRGLAVGTRTTTLHEVGSTSATVCNLTMIWATEQQTACQTSGPPVPPCDDPGGIISVAGLVPPLPLGGPTVSGRSLVWSIHNTSHFDAGFGGLSSTVTSTITVTISTP